MRVLRSPPFVAATGLALLWCGAGGLLALWFASRIRDWSVMTDELQYAKLALAVADTYSPLPSLHGVSVPAANQLYPLLLAPLYGALSSPDAFRASHVLGALVMASAVVPAYLLARQLLARRWSFAVSVLTVVTPWIVLTGFLMSEVVAYPVFLWAILAFQRALAAPSARRELLAVAALCVAVGARTQFAALVLVLPAAILAHEAGEARGGVLQRPAAGARAALRRHRALWWAYAAGAVAALVVVLAGYRLFGAYSTTVEEGSILPADVWWSAVEHLAVVGIGCGLVPLVLGVGWMLVTLASPSGPRRAFATLSLLTIAALSIQTASFDLRFGGEDIVRDRYLFYVVPLLLVGSAAALEDARRARVAIGVAGVTAVSAAAASSLAFPTFPGISVDSPVSILNEALIEYSGTLGTGTFVGLTVAALGVVVVVSLLVVPRLPLALGIFTVVLAFSLVMVEREGDRVLDGTSLSQRRLAGPPGVVLDWVDTVLPPGETAALVPFPISTAWGISAIQWWDVEFWNRTVTRSYSAPDGNFTYTPFPDRTLEIDRRTGTIEGTADAPAYVVVAAGDPRFGLAGAEHAVNAAFRVLAVERPYRAVWSSAGLQTDGWTTPGKPASIRFFAARSAGAEVVRVEISLIGPPVADVSYRIATETADRSGAVAAGTTAKETVFACVAPEAPVDVAITSPTRVAADGPPLHPEPGPKRLVGVGIRAIRVEATGQACG